MTRNEELDSLHKKNLEIKLQRAQSEYQNRFQYVWNDAYKSRASTSDNGASARNAADSAIANDYQLKSLKSEIKRIEGAIEDLDPAVRERKEQEKQQRELQVKIEKEHAEREKPLIEYRKRMEEHGRTEEYMELMITYFRDIRDSDIPLEDVFKSRGLPENKTTKPIIDTLGIISPEGDSNIAARNAQLSIYLHLLETEQFLEYKQIEGDLEAASIRYSESTETDFQLLLKKFRSIEGFKNTEAIASVCEMRRKYDQEAPLQRKAEQARKEEIFNQSKHWLSQGKCGLCGGDRKGIIKKKCVNCGIWKGGYFWVGDGLGTFKSE